MKTTKEQFNHIEEILNETWPDITNCPHNCKKCMGKCIYRKEEYQE